MDDPYTNSREVEDIKEESSTVRRVFNRDQNGHMIDNNRKEHPSFMAKDTPVSL